MKVEKCSQDLENEVIFAGLCIHCGSCNAFCPHMDFNSETGEAYVVDECTETVGLCYNSCPRSFLPISEMEKKLFGQTRTDLSVGVYKDIILVKSKNKENVLYNLVSAAFEKGIIKHLVVRETKSTKPPLSYPKVVDKASEAKKYIPEKSMDNVGPLIAGIGEAYADKKKEIGIIANPCHIQGLSKIIASEFNTGAERTTLKIAFACASGGMAGCKYCIDFSGEFSDISYSEYGGDKKKGEVMLIIRTETGQKVVDAAKQKGLIEVVNPTPDLSEMKKFINKKRKKNFRTLLGKDIIKAKYLQLNVDEMKDFLQE